ncbi:4a-hydroxytetrahydrobiopterin dehydratase [Halodurantibacterium flavum]|uniref:Putative pterin-4-alpha-carbinolamine dehydratase n=1 Tax=Halodurantibacterium flavum TaxID=1382802 RepID=A0ABW4S754_9RHOB
MMSGTHPEDPELGDDLVQSGWRWREDRKAIVKTFEFRNFREAFAWMMQVAFWAEKLNHHPEWRNVYKRVEVELTSHNSGSVTEADLKLARHMDEAATRMAGHDAP